MRGELRIAGFWKKPEARRGLTNWIVQTLDDTDLYPSYDELPALAEEVMDLAKANDAKLTKPAPCPHGVDAAVCPTCQSR